MNDPETSLTKLTSKSSTFNVGWHKAHHSDRQSTKVENAPKSLPVIVQMGSFDEEELCSCLSSVLLKDNDDLDEDFVEYLVGMICDGDTVTLEEVASADVDEESGIYQAIGPFLESSGCEEEIIIEACRAVKEMAMKSAPTSSSSNNTTSNADGARKLKQGMVSMSSELDNRTEAEEDATRFMWGTDAGVAAYVNEQKDAHNSTVSAKDKRKQKQELEKARREYQAKLEAMQREEEKEGTAVVSAMVLPDYDSGRNEKDIHCKNVGVSLDNGRILLENADLKFAHKRRYGLVGKVSYIIHPSAFNRSIFSASF